MAQNRVAELRQAQVPPMSPTGLADRLGVRERTVYRWERGESGIPDEKKLALAELFGVSVLWLMGWEEEGNGGNGQRLAA